jgi:hypothetical protein
MTIQLLVRNTVIFNTVYSNLSTDSFITDNLEKAQLLNSTSTLREKLSYIISRFIIWENFEIQNAFGNSFYNVPYQRTLGQMQIALPVCLKQTKGEKAN